MGTYGGSRAVCGCDRTINVALYTVTFWLPSIVDDIGVFVSPWVGLGALCLAAMPKAVGATNPPRSG
ncbi:hypothetical protein GCM10010330_19380 [Streptomyces tendae]|nr:hypothetical protein GCM10010330_19380 [Streptomyces tendae]